MRAATIATLVVALALSPSLGAQQTPVFRSATATVFVDVAVKKGNNPVLGLTSSDFVVLDNGVPQHIAVLAMEAVPIDVSLFIDTSGSTAGALEEMRKAVVEVAAMLRPGDRFRLLTIGSSVYQPIPWTNAGAPLGPMDIWPVQGLSLVYDAVYAATLHIVEPGRRHLVVALTDGDDECSIIRPTKLRVLSERTDAAVHWIPKGGLAPQTSFDPGTFHGGRATCVDAQDEPRGDHSTLESVTLGTGGFVHDGLLGSLRGDNASKAFRRVLEDYRQSYVLHYTPEGVERTGWHQLKVDVTSGKYEVRARPRYFGG